MKIIKFFIWLLVIAVILLAIAMFVVAKNLDGIVHSTVEKVGSDTLKTQVTLKDVHVSLLDGRIELQGLRIHNPKGFSDNSLFKLDDIVVAVVPASLFGPLIDVTEITIDGGKVLAEQNAQGINLKTLLNNLDSGSAQGEDASKNSEKGTDAAMRIRVDAFAFTQSSMDLVSEQFGERTVKAPSIHLTNVGGKQGVPPEALAKAFMQPIIAQMSDAAQNALKDYAKQEGKKQIKKEQDKLKKKLDKKLGEGAAEKLKGVFGQ